MANEFASCVEYGLNLSKRIYYGKESVSAPAVVTPAMSRSPEDFLPSAMMVYAVVPDPAVVDNPDIPSYQPYVHGRCVPPALVPLHMYGVSMEIECCLDTAFVTVSGLWRVHCIMAGKNCDCEIAIPMGEQGSLLGVEVDISVKSYHTKSMTRKDTEELEKLSKGEGGRFLNSHIYTLKIPQIEGGSTLSIKTSWCQRMLYEKGQCCLSVPFAFPAYVVPVGKKLKKEKILLNVDSGTSAEILCKTTSHPLKELSREAGKASFSYEAEVPAWSTADFKFLFTVSSSDLFGGVLLQSPSLNDFDQRQMFCFYLFPGNDNSRKVFRKEVVFVIDISGSMRGSPLENVKNALLASLSMLNPQDSFNIIAFNGETHLFSSSILLATKEAILNASQWIGVNFSASGGTSILLPLKQAMKMFSGTGNSIPLIVLVTDGAVEDEREICNTMKGSLTSRGSTCPRICTFGIGSYCNHYFLQMLAQVGRGLYDAAYEPDLIQLRFQNLFNTASSVILADITIDILGQPDALELYPSRVPDLSSENPLTISGRYYGEFPDSVKISGTMADMSNFELDLKVKKAKIFPLDRVLARRQIDILTAQAWLSDSKELEEKVSKMSIFTGVPSEYTRMVLLEVDREKKAAESTVMQEVYSKFNLMKKVNLNSQKMIFLGNLGVGFGNFTATAENLPPGMEEPKSPEAAEMLLNAASNCCGRLLDRCCCMCFIQTCSYMNNQCSIILAQICAALACFECINCCFELCECV